MIVLGLTGSIAMGKSTTAEMFRAEGVPVYDADATVHRLYSAGGAAVEPIRSLAPESVVDNSVDRGRLGQAILADPGLLQRIEAVVHPLAAAERTAFLRESAGAGVVLLDIPLLFESGADSHVDKIIVVTADPAIQRARALARPGMTEEKFTAILGRQTPDAEKRARADYIIDTGLGPDPARAQVRAILAELKGAQ